jgi:thiamine monophosphate synthase
MRLEDALLYLILDSSRDGEVAAFCSQAIAGGVDVIQLPATLAADSDQLQKIRQVCRQSDALLLVADDAAAAVAGEVDGVHLTEATASVGQARAALGVGGLVGMSTRTRSDAMLGIEMGLDYLLHWEGPLSPGTFALLPGAAGGVLFAAGLNSLEDAQRVVDQGVYRLCIESKLISEGDVTEGAAAYSRVLGRSM